MSNREYLFLQKVVTHDKQDEVFIEHVESFAYIENGSMDGGKLILKLVDSAALYRDDYAIVKGAELVVTMADWHDKGNQIWIETFVVAKANLVDGLYVIEGFEKHCHQLKQPVDTPRFFTNMQPAAILTELLPNLKVICDQFERGATYHLNNGGTKSRLIRSMARDYGAMCFISRGEVHFKSIKNLAMTPEFTLEHSNPTKADHSIANYEILGEEGLFERVLNRQYMDWNIVEGLQSSGAGAKVMVSLPQAKALNNQHVAIVPVLDVELNGYSTFRPSKVCSVLFHKQIAQQELDESLPEKQIINQVVHYQSGTRYQCRLELGVKNA